MLAFSKKSRNALLAVARGTLRNSRHDPFSLPAGSSAISSPRMITNALHE